MTNKPAYQILGVGPAIVDYVLPVSHEFLASVPGKKNGMMPLEEADFQALLNRADQPPHILAGGSCSNTLKGLAKLGHRCALLGPIGGDEAAMLFRQSLERYGIHALLLEKNKPTERVLCLVDPNGHRTFRSHLGAGKLLEPQDMPYSAFEGTQLVHLEGYSLLNPGILPTAMKHAKQAGAKVSMNLSSHEIVTIHYDELMQLLEEHVDIVFCNEDEAVTLSKDSPEKGCRLLSHLCEVAIVSKGPQGCLVGRSGKVEAYPAYPVEPLDTTGAGDFFAGGFLHGYMQHRPLVECAHYGAVLGNAVVQVMGAEIPEELWPSLRERLSIP